MLFMCTQSKHHIRISFSILPDKFTIINISSKSLITSRSRNICSNIKILRILDELPILFFYIKKTPLIKGDYLLF